MKGAEMDNDSGTAKMQAKIGSILAGVFGLSAKAVNGNSLLSDFFSGEQGALRSFVVRLEGALKIPIGEAAMEHCRTVGELAAYCVKHKASGSGGGRMYVIVCRMPNGSVCEWHYQAKGHEAAAKLAMDDGVAEILSVEREDVEDLVERNRIGFWSKFMLPLILGLIVSVGGVAIFWWRRGCPKFW